MSHYLVTGGAGFIGSHLVDRLLAQNHTVTVFDDLSSGSVNNVPSGSNFIKGNISNYKQISTLFKNDFDGCFHLAARTSVHDSIIHYLETHKINCLGTIHIFNAAKNKQIPVVYTSSSSVYGNNSRLPLTESELRTPISPYAADKASCELHAEVISNLYHIPILGLRLFNIYGPRQLPVPINSAPVIPNFLNNITHHKPIMIYGDGSQIRDFIYIKDAIDALLLAMHSASIHINVVNICTGSATTINKLIKIIEKVIDFPIKVEHENTREGEINHSIGSTLNAEAYLKFHPKIPLEQGIRETYKWHLSNSHKFT